jgi:hypothetical protein
MFLKNSTISSQAENGVVEKLHETSNTINFSQEKETRKKKKSGWYSVCKSDG